MLCQASEAPHPGSAFSEPNEGKGIPKMAHEMMRSPHTGLRNKAAQFTEWNREIQSIASTAKIQTECFDDPEIADTLAQDDFDFEDLRREPITVYIILPPSMLSRQSKFIRLLITSALQANMRPREPHEQRILFILDEAGSSLGHMQILEDTWALVRGYGIQFLLVFQDINQLKAIYDKRWETFIANAGVIASFGPNDMTTAEWLSKRMGEKTKLNTTVTVTRGQSGGTSSGHGQSPGGGSMNAGVNDGWSYNANANTGGVKVPFMSPQELFGLPTGYLVIIASGLAAVAFSYAPAYYEIPARKARARPNPYYDRVPRRRTFPPPDTGGGSVPPAADPGSPGFDKVLRLFHDKQRLPSPAPWQRAARPTPPPPAQRHLLPPEDWRDWEDGKNDS
jgi:type IV secretory pathway TraG/TraD family ATPase VirD4